jgi:hypothetical protein
MSTEGAEAPPCQCFATEEYLAYVDETKHWQGGCIGGRLPCQLWRGALVLARSRPEMALFRDLVVSLQISLCGVHEYASA